MSNKAWRSLFAIIAAVASYSLATDLHPDVVLSPIIQFALGAILVGLAVIRAPEDDPPPIA